MGWVEKMQKELLALPGVTCVKMHARGLNGLEITIDGGDDTAIARVVLKHRPMGVWSSTTRSHGRFVSFANINKSNLVAEVDRFPHKCPRCGQRAYVGFASVEHEGAAC